MSDPVLVIGGSRGIGRATVATLVAQGRRVAFTWRAAEGAAREVEAASEGLARGFAFDVRDRAGAGPLVEQVEAALGPLFGLVYCAGERRDGLLALASDEDWDSVLDTNLGGLFRLCRAVVPGMIRRRRGSIVGVSSLSGLHGVAGQALYGASKAGMLMLLRTLARECGKRGVRVNAVVPGYVPTDFVADVPEQAVAALRANECLPQGTSARSVADVVAFLLSEASAAMTGQALVIDAGTTA